MLDLTAWFNICASLQIPIPIAIFYAHIYGRNYLNKNNNISLTFAVWVIRHFGITIYKLLIHCRGNAIDIMDNVIVKCGDFMVLPSLRWRHNDHAGVSNHQPHGCLLNRLFRRKSKKTSKLRVTGLCAGNSPGTGEFPAQMASYAENVSIWWRHHVFACYGNFRGDKRVILFYGAVELMSLHCVASSSMLHDSMYYLRLYLLQYICRTIVK